MSTQFKNTYHLRKVAETSSKPCNFCYKPTTSVLITSDGSSDFFYTCDSHLKDSTFATPIYDEEYLKAKREKEALDLEIKQLKLKWDEKNRYAGWDKLMSYTRFSSDKDKDKDSKDKDSKDKDGKTPEKEHVAKLKDLDQKASTADTILLKQPRVYQLQKDIYKIRLDKKYKTKAANPNVTRSTITAKDLSSLPSVPKTPL